MNCNLVRWSSRKRNFNNFLLRQSSLRLFIKKKKCKEKEMDNGTMLFNNRSVIIRKFAFDPRLGSKWNPAYRLARTKAPIILRSELTRISLPQLIFRGNCSLKGSNELSPASRVSRRILIPRSSFTEPRVRLLDWVESRALYHGRRRINRAARGSTPPRLIDYSRVCLVTRLET